MISHRHRCLFIHVPKTAGKSVLNLFGLPLLGADYDGAMDWIEDPYGHVPAQTYRKRSWFRSYFKFAIVRHPLDRLVSAFNFLDRGGLNEGDRNFSEQNLTKFGGDFQKFVAEGLRDSIEYFHFRPQTHWLCNRWGFVLVDYVGRFELLEEAMKYITQQIDLEHHRIEHLNASVHTRWEDYYDKRTRQIATKVYFEDFYRFKYNY